MVAILDRLVADPERLKQVGARQVVQLAQRVGLPEFQFAAPRIKKAPLARRRRRAFDH